MLPVPLSRMVAPYARTAGSRPDRSAPPTLIPVTNAVESLHRSLRKIIETRGSFLTDEAALMLLFLAIRNAGVRWRRSVGWTAAIGQFAILFGDRFYTETSTLAAAAQGDPGGALADASEAVRPCHHHAADPRLHPEEPRLHCRASRELGIHPRTMAR